MNTTLPATSALKVLSFKLTKVAGTLRSLICSTFAKGIKVTANGSLSSEVAAQTGLIAPKNSPVNSAYWGKPKCRIISITF